MSLECSGTSVGKVGWWRAFANSLVSGVSLSLFPCLPNQSIHPPFPSRLTDLSCTSLGVLLWTTLVTSVRTLWMVTEYPPEEYTGVSNVGKTVGPSVVGDVDGSFGKRTFRIFNFWNFFILQEVFSIAGKSSCRTHLRSLGILGPILVSGKRIGRHRSPFIEWSLPVLLRGESLRKHSLSLYILLFHCSRWLACDAKKKIFWCCVFDACNLDASGTCADAPTS